MIDDLRDKLSDCRDQEARYEAELERSMGRMDDEDPSLVNDTED